jgi:hypothetical protein
MASEPVTSPQGSPLPRRRERHASERAAARQREAPPPAVPDFAQSRRDRTRHQRARHSETIYRIVFTVTALVVAADLVIGALHIPIHFFPVP